MSQEDKDLETKLRAISWHRDGIYADRLAFDIALAVEHGHADVIRTALSKVFDLSAIEEAGKRHIALLTRIQEEGGQVRDLLGKLHLEAKAIQERLDKAGQVAAKLEARNGQGAQPGSPGAVPKSR